MRVYLFLGRLKNGDFNLCVDSGYDQRIVFSSNNIYWILEPLYN